MSFKTEQSLNIGYYNTWHFDAGIADVMPVEPSAMITSGALGWIRMSYDNSTSTETLNWVEVEELENQIKLTALNL